METADAARAGRRKNLSLGRAPRARRQKQTFDAAFETFYRDHVAEVYQYALAVLGSSPDAEDVTQQTFLNAYRAFERGERPRKAHNWLIKIAHNVCRMRWRQLGRRPQEVPLETAGEPASPEDDTPSLDEVLTALARLPFNQRASIVMREVEGRSYAEIAEVLGTTVPAVEALLFRARGNLRARRSALSGALSIAPVPAGLGSFIGGGSGGLVAGGGAILGSQLALKAAAVVATSVVAGGLGFKAVDAVATPDRQAAVPRLHEQARHVVEPVPQRHAGAAVRRTVDAAAFGHSRPAVSRHGALRQVPTNDLPSPSDASAASATSSSASSATGGSAPVVGAPASSTVSTAPVDKIVASVPEPPAVTATTVAVETPVAAVTVTVPPVQLPPPPLK